MVAGSGSGNDRGRVRGENYSEEGNDSGSSGVGGYLEALCRIERKI